MFKQLYRRQNGYHHHFRSRPETKKSLIAEYAKMHGESMSGFILETVLDKIEDEIDLRDMEEAISEHDTNPRIYTHDEIKRELGL